MADVSTVMAGVLGRLRDDDGRLDESMAAAVLWDVESGVGDRLRMQTIGGLRGRVSGLVDNNGERLMSVVRS